MTSDKSSTLHTAKASAQRNQPFFADYTLCFVFLCALLHGLVYASFLPPWGLIDEGQHLHYIQHIAEQQTLPIMGQTHLSTEIADSLFATNHWAVFHWPTPVTTRPSEMGLVGDSYEAYQPPLFYALMAPIFALLPGNILTKLFLMRGVMVLFSLMTLGALYQTAALLWGKASVLPLFAVLLLLAIPERTIAVSRINNDVLAELLAALFIWELTQSMLRGVTLRRGLTLGFLFGLGLWTKLSMAVLVVPLIAMLIFQRRCAKWQTAVIAAYGGAALLSVPLIFSNLWRYGDITGFASFRALHQIIPPPFDLANIGRATYDLFRHTWMIWWKGSSAETNVVVNGFQLALGALVVIAVVGGMQRLWHTRQDKGESNKQHNSASAQHSIFVIYAITVIMYGLAVLTSYFLGMIPVIQGRFLLPTMVPLVLFLVWGFGRSARGLSGLTAMIVLLFILDLLSLWGNLLPYFYFWSDVVAQSTREAAAFNQPGTWLPILQRIYAHVLADKPAFIAVLLPWIFGIYLVVMLLLSLFLAIISSRLRAAHVDFFGYSHNRWTTD